MMKVRHDCFYYLVLMLLTGYQVTWAEGLGLQAKPGWPEPIHDDTYYGKLMFDRLEYQQSDQNDAVLWDVQGWYGGDINRLWIETEGEHITSTGDTELENVDVQFSHLLAPFWDIQVGVSHQANLGSGSDENRTSLVLGFQGLAPYWFEVDSNLRVSERGDVAIDMEFEYDWRFTQQLVLQLRGETRYAFSEVSEFGVGEGLSGITLGLRLRYHFNREFAPYIGISRQELIGNTQDLANEEDQKADQTQFVVGARFWF